MHKETITKDDGRYLIYYTFDDAGQEKEPTRPVAPPMPQQHVASENVIDDGPAPGGRDGRPGSGAEPEA